MCTTADIVLGSLTLNTIDSDGTRWFLNDLDGWHTLPDVELPDSSRGFSDDGSYELDGRYAPRIITLTGTFIPTSKANTKISRARLTAAINSVRGGTTLTVKESPDTKAAVWLSAKPNITTEASSGLTKFQITMRAPDPRKYSVTRNTLAISNSAGTLPSSGIEPYLTPPITIPAPTIAGGLAVPNVGDYNTYPTFTITGPANVITLYNTTSNTYIRIVYSFAAGHSLVIDTKARTILQDGSINCRAYMTNESSWFNIDPGSTTKIVFVDNSGSATCSVAYSSAWIG